ncbi:uncharacterized protein N7500_006891 [Penicillium coprophilum]|uniref:uncharacterized protein n=1 Tax=Penicillium coprophilum TaxID=36646 RepID=UPI0023A1A98B|nr:uncharacterized protein N7500_006891 [Penicillium coprophilum]KAJ5165061.1 hypothetical protein N7500_006891 [Penicillium coprophilum]
MDFSVSRKMRFLVILTCLASHACALSVVPSLTHIPAGVRAACRTTLAKNITQCSDEFEKELQFIPSTSLAQICTTECTGALSALYTEAMSRCGTDSVDVVANDTVLATFTPIDVISTPSLLSWAYGETLTFLSRDGGFCKDKLEDVTEDELCSECYMKSVQLEINQPGEDPAYHQDDFDALKKSCGIPTTSYPVTPAPSGTPPAEIPVCASKYTIKASDTANTIAKALSVATDRLLAYNGLPISSEEPLTAGDTLCLDEVSKCMIHQVVVADTCSSLMKLAGSSVDELMLQSWNPTIGTKCANIKTMTGKYICIGPPGQTSTFTPVNPPTTSTPVTTPTDTYTWEPAPDSITSTVNMTTIWAFPTEVAIATLTAEDPDPAQVTGLLERSKFCPFNGEDDEEWDEGLEDEEYHLHSWDLDTSCLHDHWDPYCYPNLSDSVLPSPTDIPSSCYPTVTTIIPDGWVDPLGLLNQASLTLYKITLSQFYKYNPSINAQCSNTRATFAVCVRIWEEPEAPTPTSAGPPGPTGTGTSPTCAKWHLWAKGDTCNSIAAKYNILVSRFRQLNRSVNSACDNTVVGNAYCVG